MADPFVGTELKATFTFKNEAGAPTDPTTITAKIMKPSDNTVTTYVYPTTGFTRASAGIYALVWTPDVGGYWQVEAKGTGAVKATEDVTQYVLASSFG